MFFFVFFQCSENHRLHAIWFNSVPKISDILMRDTSKTWQLTTKQSRWMNSTTGTFWFWAEPSGAIVGAPKEYVVIWARVDLPWPALGSVSTWCFLQAEKRRLCTRELWESLDNRRYDTFDDRHWPFAVYHLFLFLCLMAGCRSLFRALSPRPGEKVERWWRRRSLSEKSRDLQVEADRSGCTKEDAAGDAHSSLGTMEKRNKERTQCGAWSPVISLLLAPLTPEENVCSYTNS